MGAPPVELSFARRLLLPLAAGYAAVVRLRNRSYDRRPERAARVDVPVISVGNCTVGGTGKTPMVIELARLLLDDGRRPAILTRGYGARPGQVPDEVAEFHAALPDVPVIVDPDRVAGAAVAIERHHADVLLLDDGFQHRRLHRDLDLVLVDALDPWGGGALLPAGRLREPLAPACARAGAFLLTRANQVERDRRTAIRRRLRSLNHDAPILDVGVKIEQCVGAAGPRALDDLAYHNVMPVCGIGNPRTFLQLVGELAGRCCRPLVYADHHHYTAHDARHIARVAARHNADLIVTTRKDWSKLAPLWAAVAANGAPELVRLEARADFEQGGREALRDVLRGALRPPASP